MSLNDILKIALTIIGCFGGVGAIVSATVKFTSEKIAERLEKKYELRLNKELEEFCQNFMGVSQSLCKPPN